MGLGVGITRQIAEQMLGNSPNASTRIWSLLRYIPVADADLSASEVKDDQLASCTARKSSEASMAAASTFAVAFLSLLLNVQLTLIAFSLSKAR